MNYLTNRLLYRIQNIHAAIEERSEPRELRIQALKQLKNPLVKNAFDTRRVNSDTDFNPRRNLQNYHRSTPFISEGAAEQLKTFFRLKTAVDSIKNAFVGDPDWLDSYARILSTALDRTLRVEQKDMDFFQPQLDYLNEMLYLRYRLKDNDIAKMADNELRNAILSKDEKLLYKHIYANYNNNQMTKETNNVAPSMAKETSRQPSSIEKDTHAEFDNETIAEQKPAKIKSKDDRGVNITINVG